jgi:hypothetical protein
VGKQIGMMISSRQTGMSPVSRNSKTLQLAAAIILTATLSGCSISASLSDSVSSPFKWSSDSLSSSSKGAKESYQSDIRDYTEAYVKSSSNPDDFKKGLASVANKHGISNWEADEATYTGIGAGLAKAQASEMQVEVYKTNLSQGDAVKASAIQKGYAQYKKEQ